MPAYPEYIANILITNHLLPPKEKENALKIMRKALESENASMAAEQIIEGLGFRENLKACNIIKIALKGEEI